jgi:hypothetical protein
MFEWPSYLQHEISSLANAKLMWILAQEEPKIALHVLSMPIGLGF